MYADRMRLVAVADTHTFESDLGEIPAGDVFIHAGDLCRGGSLDELAGVAAWIRGLPHPHKLVIAGNHDWCFARPSERGAARELLGPGVIYLEDSGAVLDGVTFWGSPWQPAFNDWAFNLPRGAPLAEKWAQIPAGTHVLVTHGPPRGFGDATSQEDRAGCDDLRAALVRVRPLLHLFGHIHQDGGVWRDGVTTLANVTTWECERPATVFDVDSATLQVTPVAVPPRDPRHE
jgi:predicted phosphohydrolase